MLKSDQTAKPLPLAGAQALKRSLGGNVSALTYLAKGTPNGDTDPAAYLELMRNYKKLEVHLEKLKVTIQGNQEALKAKDNEIATLKSELTHFVKYRYKDQERLQKEEVEERKAEQAASNVSLLNKVCPGLVRDTWRPTANELEYYVGKSTAKEFVSQLAAIKDDLEAHTGILYELLHRVIVKAREFREMTLVLQEELKSYKDTTSKLSNLQRAHEIAELDKANLMEDLMRKDDEAKKLLFKNEVILQEAERSMLCTLGASQDVYDACAGLRNSVPSKELIRGYVTQIYYALRTITADLKASCKQADPQTIAQTTEFLSCLDAAICINKTLAKGLPKAGNINVAIDQDSSTVDSQPLDNVQDDLQELASEKLQISYENSSVGFGQSNRFLSLLLQTVAFSVCVLISAKTSANNVIPRPLVKKALSPTDKESLRQCAGEARNLLSMWHMARGWFEGVTLKEETFLNVVDAFLKAEKPPESTPEPLKKSTLEARFERVFQAVLHPKAPDELLAVKATFQRIAQHSLETAKMNWNGLRRLHQLERMKNAVAAALAGKDVDHLIRMYTDRVTSESQDWKSKRALFGTTRRALWCDFLNALKVAEENVMKSGINLKSIQMSSGSAVSLALLAHRRIVQYLKHEPAQQHVLASVAQSRTSRWEDRSFVIAAREKFLDAKFGMASKMRPQSSLGGLQLQAAMKRLTNKQRASPSYEQGSTIIKPSPKKPLLLKMEPLVTPVSLIASSPVRKKETM